MANFLDGLPETPEVISGTWTTTHGQIETGDNGITLVIGDVREQIGPEGLGSMQIARTLRRRRAQGTKWLDKLTGSRQAEEHLLSVELRSRRDRLRLVARCEASELEDLPTLRVVGEEVPLDAFRAAVVTALSQGARLARFAPAKAIGFALPVDAADRKQISAGLRGSVRFDDDAIISDLVDLGFSAGTLGVLPFIPLVEVAWSDGGVSEEEANTLTDLAMMHGGEEMTPMARLLLLDLLQKQPEPGFLEQSRDVLIRIFNTLQPDEQDRAKLNLLNLAIEVARASGGFLGFGDKISPEERAVLKRIAEQLKLNESADALLKKLTGRAG